MTDKSPVADEIVVQATDLTKKFKLRRKRAEGTDRKWFTAVDSVSFTLRMGETLALVGESGSGKTTVGKILVRLESPSGGSVSFAGGDLLALRSRRLRRARRGFQMVFQDPYESLDPRCTVGSSVEEPLRALTGLNGAERRKLVIRMLESVGLGPGEDMADRYPHELSGGQRQRAAIGRALIVEPRFVVADEPVSMLDVSIRAGVLELLKDLCREKGVAMVFITHDLAVARHMATTVAVMYRGQIVETGPTASVIDDPQHSYTKLLLASVSRIEADQPSGTG